MFNLHPRPRRKPKPESRVSTDDIYQHVANQTQNEICDLYDSMEAKSGTIDWNFSQIHTRALDLELAERDGKPSGWDD